uniref:Uncharacterized protein n=1 Tax=Leersia perrieri TaxID=77586 RepID=A0A0D9W901_9ORYZ
MANNEMEIGTACRGRGRCLPDGDRYCSAQAASELARTRADRLARGLQSLITIWPITRGN